MLKDNVDIFAPILADIFNDCIIKKGMFADVLNLQISRQFLSQ